MGVTSTFVIIVVHQALFQGMFVAKNLILRKRLGRSIRGRNREALAAIFCYIVFIVVSVFLSMLRVPIGAISMPTFVVRVVVSLPLLAATLAISAAALVGLQQSWRVGVREGERTELIQSGIYRYSRNPYFLSYIIMFVGYTILLASWILFVLSAVGVVLTHRMIRSEEDHLARTHGESYEAYRSRVPRYLLLKKRGSSD
jgi:protein-S-isoprenylcysteine O-methyltransferase Ste14